MTAAQAAHSGRWRAIAWAIAAAVALVFAAANAHLVYVATTSQPDCVPHARGGSGAAGAFVAAQTVCESPASAGSQQMEDRP
jgi:hypothetical protein